MKSKYFFEEFKEEIEKEHKEFETHLEEKAVPSEKCNHKGKVKAIPGGIRCQCGAMWTGYNIQALMNHFNVGV